MKFEFLLLQNRHNEYTTLGQRLLSSADICFCSLRAFIK